jgi:hypothetical protein
LPYLSSKIWRARLERGSALACLPVLVAQVNIADRQVNKVVSGP